MASRRSKGRSSRRSTVRRGPRGSRGPKGSETGIWIGALALAAAAAVGTAVYLTEKKAGAAAPPPGVLPVGPPAPGPAPSQLPTTGDVYSSLSAAQQSQVNAALYAYIVQGYASCPSVFPNGMADVTSNGITNAASLANQGNRSLAVDCYQQGNSLSASSGAGVLDLSTYRSLVGV
jgi:hypothetical protein